MLKRRQAAVRGTLILAFAIAVAGLDSANGESWLDQERDNIRNVQVPPTDSPPLNYRPPPIVPIEPKYDPDPFGAGSNPPPRQPAANTYSPPPTPMTPAQVQSLKDLAKDTATLQPPPAPRPPAATSTPSYQPPRATVTGFQAPQNAQLPARSAPGGISLSKAAAARMPLDIVLDASSFSEGRIVLSGRSASGGMDAALLLTAFRVACDGRDPYFSLDPDNGAAWSSQGNEASRVFWERIKKDFPGLPSGKKPAAGLDLRTVSAARDYPDIWRAISPNYPNFRAKLVFYPEWLSQTRFGEALYKADVLLKELSSGVSILRPGALRAAQINGYLAADAEQVGKTLLSGAQSRGTSSPQWRGSRLWFDIAPSPSVADTIPETERASSSGDPQLQSLLRSRGLVRPAAATIQNASVVVRHGDVSDLSQINPRMFVRVHDHASNKDLSDHDPRLDGLANDVSLRFDQYAAAYEELRILRDLFRAYVVAVQVTEKDARLCQGIAAQQLLDAERVSGPLPEYHRSELFVTVANYWTISRKGRQSSSAQASSMSGGVSIAGRKFTEGATRDGQTGITQMVASAVTADRFDQPDRSDPGRKFISLVFDAAFSAPLQLVSSSPGSLFRVPALVPETAAVFAGRGPDEIENEPPAARMPVNERNNSTVWTVLLGLLALAFLVRYGVRSSRPPGRAR